MPRLSRGCQHQRAALPDLGTRGGCSTAATTAGCSGHSEAARASCSQDGETGGLRIQTAAPRLPSSPVQHPAHACCAGMSWCCCFVSHPRAGARAVPSTPCPWPLALGNSPALGQAPRWHRDQAEPERNSSASPQPFPVAFSQPCRAALSALSSWKLLGREFSGLCAFPAQPHPCWQAGRAGIVVAAKRPTCSQSKVMWRWCLLQRPPFTPIPVPKGQD